MSSNTRLIFEAQRRLRSASSLTLNVRRTRLSTVSDQAFLVTAAPTFHVRSLYQLGSMSVLQGRIKAFLFSRYFPWLLPQLLKCLTTEFKDILWHKLAILAACHFRILLKIVLFRILRPTYLLTHSQRNKRTLWHYRRAQITRFSQAQTRWFYLQHEG